MDEDNEWGLDSPRLPQSTAMDTLQAQAIRTNALPSQDAAFFKLPLELRNAIYRLLAISPLSRATDCLLYRPICADDAVFSIGYFKRDTVVPLLQTCRQIHSEASSILYGENVFVFHVSNLASGTVSLFELLPEEYLRLMRRAYLLTEYFLPWSLQPSDQLDLTTGGIDEADENRMLVRRDMILKIELEGSKMVARKALPARSGFAVNVHDTISLPTKSTHGRLWQSQAKASDEEWGSSSLQLWKMVPIELADSTYRQEFRRATWTREVDNPEDQTWQLGAGEHSSAISDSGVF
ncbi:MAG: hypothetical protein L6R39_004638 [Caloplaca ligustica]|nr:MAG: hypothetical protein L6R39_004638 [Caloplaca ligustica]